MTWLTAAWWLAVLVGGTAVVVGVVRRSARPMGLWVGAVSFVVAGVLGLASIGAVFLVAAAACAVAAVRADPA